MAGGSRPVATYGQMCHDLKTRVHHHSFTRAPGRYRAVSSTKSSIDERDGGGAVS